MALTNAQRSRAHRARQRAGLKYVRPLVNYYNLIDALLDTGHLQLDLCEDELAVEDALADFLDEFSKSETRCARRRLARGIFRNEHDH